METVLQGIFSATEEGTSATKEGFLGTIGTLFKIIAAISTLQFSEAGGLFKSLFGGATGGMIPGKMPMSKFASGGIAKAPQLALIGEGSRNEAVVPLPNNREIPVDMKGSSGDVINIEQNFDFRNADPSTITSLRREARAIGDQTFNRVFTEINKGGKYAAMVGRR